jgi:hypothetical protein
MPRGTVGVEVVKTGLAIGELPRGRILVKDHSWRGPINRVVSGLPLLIMVHAVRNCNGGGQPPEFSWLHTGLCVMNIWHGRRLYRFALSQKLASSC